MTDRYAVIGNPIEHSRSPEIHSAFALQTGEDLVYTRVLGDLKHFEQDVARFMRGGGLGLNVTVPFKERAWRLAAHLNEAAKHSGAVNTLIVTRAGQLLGDNTDGAGLVRDLTVNQGYHLANSRILLLGAGGAVRGVVRPLLSMQPRRLVIANRTTARAEALAVELSDYPQVEACSLQALAEKRFDLIINGTAAGLEGRVPAVPDNILAPGGWTYDLMYASGPTEFVRWGKAHGADKALDGLGMLVEQAAESFYLWRGIRPDTGPVIRQLRSGRKPAALTSRAER